MRRNKRSFSILLLGSVLILSGCAGQHSNRPLLSAPPSAAADNDIYIGDAQGRIRALKPDGTRQWTFSLPDEIVRLDDAASRDIRIDHLAAHSGGKLFGLATEETGHRAGSTILFSMDGNHLLWKTDVPFPEQNGPPIVVGSDAVYEAGDDGALYAFARADGHQLWKYQVSQGTLGAPTIGADGTIYVAGARNNLHAVSPDGTQRWVAEDQR
jgi:outer membrane protein assembly factor BamB